MDCRDWISATEWLFGAAPPEVKQGLPKFKTPRFTRTVSQWLNLLIETGLRPERIEEPRPSDETVRACPDMQDAQVVAYFLHIRARKPEQTTALFNKPEIAHETRAKFIRSRKPGIIKRIPPDL